jgi:hypothetical protein
VEPRLAAIERKLRLLQWLVIANLVATVLVLISGYFFG